MTKQPERVKAETNTECSLPGEMAPADRTESISRPDSAQAAHCSQECDNMAKQPEKGNM